MQLWHVYLLAFLLGMNTCFENPARQSFVLEMVGPADLRNAVSLNSVLVNAARAVGPAIAGIIISTGGVGLCFLLNALSFVAVVSSLATLDTSRLQPSVPAVRAKGQLREGLRYVRATPRLAIPLLMMAIVGCLAYEFSVTLPVLAKQTFGGQASTYGFMTAAMGVGAVVGGLYVAARGRTGTRALVNSAARVHGGARGCGAGTDAVAGAARPRPGRRGQRRLPVQGQQHPAAGGQSADARPGDGAVGGGLPRFDADRRPDRRLGE